MDSDASTAGTRAAAQAGGTMAPAASSTGYDMTPEQIPDHIIVCMRTSQTQQWRMLVDFLKDLITECPITFGEDGMKLCSLDPVKVALLHLHAKSEFYFCRTPTVIGVNMVALYKMLRNLTTGGYMLEFSMSSLEPDVLSILLINSDKRTSTSNKLKLMKLPEEGVAIPSTNFKRVLSIPSADFQRYIRELSAISNKIRIKSTADQLILSASGTMGSSEIVVRPTASGLHWVAIEKQEDDEEEDDVVEGVYFSKYLERFSRPLDSICEIFMRPNFPLILRYVLPTVTIRLVIAPVADVDGAVDM
jgi:proliferating cell nuclear antigen PCNA